MIQQVTPFLSPPSVTKILKSNIKTPFFFFLVFLLGMTAEAKAAPMLPGDTLLVATICANETYLFDNQELNMTGEYAATYLASDGSDSTVTLQLTVLPLLQETINVDICPGETYPFYGLALSQSGQYDAVLTGSNGCDSTITLTLLVRPLQITNLSAGICNGSVYLFQGDTLTESGTYHASLTDINGCDSLVRLKLEVVDFFDIHQEVTICAGETYFFGAQILDVSGVYVDSLQAIGACDSTVTLTLTILPALSSSLSIVICEGSSYIYLGDTLSDSGFYQYAFSGTNGCDSLVNLSLDMVPFFETSAVATICNGETYTLGTQSLIDEGVYLETFIAAGGCDSTVTLTLTVLPTSNGTASATVCDGESVDYNGETISDPGNYVFVLTGENGCDSTVIFTLTVLPIFNTVIEAVICHDGIYVFYGQTLTVSGVYEQIFPAENGCDSIISLILTVVPEINTSLEATICTGATYDFNGEILGQSGVYSIILPSEFGCDSTITLTLTVLPAQSSTIDASICANDSYEFDGVLLTDAGTYSAVYPDANGCDSTVTLHLAVLPVLEVAVEATICNGEIYPFNGIALTDAGVYAAVVTSSFGCDSTVNLTLTVLPTFASEFDATTCAGVPYDYLGQLLNDAGDYEFSLNAENGCDSIVTIRLTVLPTQHTPIDAEICAGGAYDYNGELLTASGAYSFVFEGANGCDSTVTVNLTVHPLYTTTINVTQCDGLTYDFNGETLDISGTYTADLSSQYGCDSTVVLNLNFVPAFETGVEATICAGASYAFGLDTLTESGEYQMTLQAVGDCDSIITLTLTVLPENASETNVAICAGGSYSFDGADLTDEGTYSAIFVGANGCDSTAVLNLSVLPLASADVEASICANTTYSFDGADLDASGVYTGVFTAVNGCDSTVTLTLTVLSALAGTAEATICAGDSYNFNGESLTQSGSYTTVYTADNGCDSVVVLTLTALPLPQSAFAALVCEGAPFEYNGEIFTESGVYTFVIDAGAVNGCDSMVVLFLTIFPEIAPTVETATVCAGESYDFQGETYDESGQYSVHLSTATGCDSSLVLNLTVLPASSSTINASICQGASYTFDGDLLTTAGTYTAVYEDINGCDSTVTLTLALDVVNVVVNLNNGVLSVTTPFAGYQWFNCTTMQPIIGANTGSYTPTVTGVYGLAVINANGCTAISSCVTVMVSDTKEPLTASNWQIQPNPAQAFTAIILKEALSSDISLEVFDPSGRLLHQQSVAAGTYNINLDISAFPDGILMVRLMSKEGVSAKLLMKGN